MSTVNGDSMTGLLPPHIIILRSSNDGRFYFMHTLTAASEFLNSISKTAKHL